MLSWQSQKHTRFETVRVVLTERGVRANGYIVQAEDDSFGASYTVLADASGRARRLTVQSDSAEGERHLALTRTPGGPWVVESTAGSQPLFALDAAQDLEIETSAFTVGLALRRLAGPKGDGRITLQHQPQYLTVGCISLPTLEVRVVRHEYTFREGSAVSYRGLMGDTDLTLDSHCFVVDFPGLATRL